MIEYFDGNKPCREINGHGWCETKCDVYNERVCTGDQFVFVMLLCLMARLPLIAITKYTPAKTNCDKKIC